MLSRVKILKNEAVKEREQESASIAIVSNRLNATLHGFFFFVFVLKIFLFYRSNLAFAAIENQ